MPAGTWTSTVAGRVTRPSPRQSRHGERISRPVPRQAEQGVAVIIWPRIVRRSVRTSPAPPPVRPAAPRPVRWGRPWRWTPPAGRRGAPAAAAPPARPGGGGGGAGDRAARAGARPPARPRPAPPPPPPTPSDRRTALHPT